MSYRLFMNCHSHAELVSASQTIILRYDGMLKQVQHDNHMKLKCLNL
jgi:hypothetical protein